MQPNLFDETPAHCKSQLAAPANQPASTSSPDTSSAAATATLPKLGGCYRAFLDALASLGKPSTAHEIAARAEAISLTPAMRETYRKRAAELVASGKIAKDGTRPCEITGFSAATYRLTQSS
jgi:hypothetical protein